MPTYPTYFVVFCLLMLLNIFKNSPLNTFNKKNPHILEKLIKATLIHTLEKNAQTVNFFLGHIKDIAQVNSSR